MPLIVMPGQASCACPSRGSRQRITRAVIARGRIEGQAGRPQSLSTAPGTGGTMGPAWAIAPALRAPPGSSPS